MKTNKKKTKHAKSTKSKSIRVCVAMDVCMCGDRAIDFNTLHTAWGCGRAVSHGCGGEVWCCWPYHRANYGAPGQCLSFLFSGFSIWAKLTKKFMFGVQSFFFWQHVLRAQSRAQCRMEPYLPPAQFEKLKSSFTRLAADTRQKVFSWEFTLHPSSLICC